MQIAVQERESIVSKPLKSYRARWIILVGGILFALMAVMPAKRVQAAEATYTKNIPLTKADFTKTVSVPKFDSELGELEQVEINFSGRLKGAAKFESLDTDRSTVVTEMSGQLDLVGPDGALLASAYPRVSRGVSVRPFDGVIDYDGPSGGAFNHLVAVDLASDSVLQEAAQLASFVGSGHIVLTVNAHATVNGSGPGNLSLTYVTEGAAAVTVKYHYRAEINPAIDLEKYTNGEDADEPTGPLIQAGKRVEWRYVVRNTGDTPLVNIVLVDDIEGTIECPQTELAIGGEMTCLQTGVAGQGQYSNTATVSGQTPADPFVPTQTVTDTDPSHYYGTPLSTFCPLDEQGSLVLPDLLYLGECGGPYALPAGFDQFIVKRFSPFRFVSEAGVESGGQRIYTLQSDNERVWACSGDCNFVSGLKKSFEIGLLSPGITIGAVVIDDDDDERLNAWVANSDVANPYLTITDQQMVENLVLDVPFEAEWSFHAEDSVGLVALCLAPTNEVRAAMIVGNGYGLPQGLELNEDAGAQPDTSQSSFTVFLPLLQN